ncbi:MAG: polysaccharide deacetylase family protein [Firmicutes bacterium]|nr:polysaccharide deacetylase family protein [Bacillota bacterium]
MKKKIILSAALATVILMGSLFARGHFGGSGRPVTIPEKNSAKTMTEAVTAAAGGNWGLCFQKDGQVPVGNATAEYLKQFHAWYVGPEEKSIWLTFDAGYENGYTEEILNVLKEEKVPAAFFLVGNYITENPDLVNRMVKEGHIVGNHTMHHPDMSEISEKEAFQKELADLETAFQQVTGAKMKKYYRPPQGKYSEANLKMADELGYTTIFWSLAYVDWLQDSQPTREEALNVLNRRIHPGAIVLLHSTSKTNSQILQELIQGWKKEGYVFRSLEELK